MSEQVGSGRVSVSVTNIGGIESVERSFDRGVTVLVGRNATNRTSLLRSIAAGLGGSYGALRGDAETGEVTLTVDGEPCRRRFRREDGTTRVEGDPYTDEGALVDLFACLLEANPLRRATVRGDGRELRELVMRPVDTAELEARIAATQRELRDVDEEIEAVDRERPDRAALERERRDLESDLEALDDEIETLRERVDDGADPDEAAVAESVVEDLREAREDLERVRDERRTQERARESLADERADLKGDLDALSAPEADLDEVEAELDRLRRRKRDLESTINSLLSIVEFNEDLVGGTGDLPLVEDEDPYEELDPESRRVECWTCGTTVERGAIADRLDDLRGVIDEKRGERNDLDARIDDLQSTRRELRDAEDERAALRERLSDVEEELDEREARIEALREREAALRERIEDLESEADDAAEAADRLADYRRLTELEYERGQLEERIDAVEADIEEAEELTAERERLVERRAELREELRALRDRVESLEREAVETFNDEMASVLDLLGYENVERVWLERTEGDEGTAFDLHVVRTSDEGVAYEDTVDHLSESEREVIGLVLALAGYLVHDVHETVPVVLLDSLEAIDADRIAALVEYVAERVPYLIVALLPEDAAALPAAYDRVRMGED